MRYCARAMDERLAELLATPSLATDLGMAFPLEKAMRSAPLAVTLGRKLGLSQADLSDAYYVAMLRFLGCSAFADELAMAFGGDAASFVAPTSRSMSLNLRSSPRTPCGTWRATHHPTSAWPASHASCRRPTVLTRVVR